MRWEIQRLRVGREVTVEKMRGPVKRKRRRESGRERNRRGERVDLRRQAKAV